MSQTTTAVKHVRVRIGRFPNDTPGAPTGTGRYCMHEKSAGLAEAVSRVYRALAPIRDQFDALYVTGQSGMVPGSVVAWRLKKDLIVLRKRVGSDMDSRHGSLVVGWAHSKPNVRYVIVDDFVALAQTMDRLLAERPPMGTLVAVCLYGHPRTDEEANAGYAKAWPAGETYLGATSEYLRLVRRGPHSILFDLVREPGWQP